MKLEGIELIRATLRMHTPFRTSFGVLQLKEAVFVRAVTADGEGWGECTAHPEPNYSAEYADGEADVIERFLAPLVLASETVAAEAVGDLLSPIRGHRTAKCAVEAAVLDAQLRSRHESLADYLGGVRQNVSAAGGVGIHDSIPALLDAVDAYVEQGYRHVKLKIAPGWDVEPIRAVRERFGSDLPIQVDANAAYTLADAAHLRRLDEFDLLLIEQPFAEDALHQHAELARRIHTPVALDESVTSATRAAEAITMGACQMINIKPGRVGGFLESRRIHDLARAHGLSVWCGGMAETGVGRAANLALSALPGFVLGDNGPSSRYYAEDLTEPFDLHDGRLEVPTGPGIGRDVDTAVLDSIATGRTWISR